MAETASRPVLVTPTTHERLTAVKAKLGLASFEIVIGRALDLLEQQPETQYTVNATREPSQNAPTNP